MAIAADICACFDPRPSSGAWWRLGAAAFLAVNAMVLGLAVNGPDVSASERLTLSIATGCVSLGIAILLGGELMLAAWTELRGGRLSLEVLFLAGIGGSFAASLISLLQGVGGTYFDVAGLLLLVYSLGREVGRYGQQRLLSQVAQPDAASSIQVGSHFQTLPGQPILADGRILRGTALLRNQSLSGESFAQSRGPGDHVQAGSFPLDASLWIEATSTPQDSEVEKMRNLIAARLLRPGPTLAAAQHALRWFVPSVASAAVGTFVWHLQTNDWPVALSYSMSVLTIACPCALGFAAPLTAWSAIARLRQTGILCRSGEALEMLAEIDTVVFDKTGTLSQPEACRAQLSFEVPWAARGPLLLRLLSAAEQASGHPIARAMAPLWQGVTPAALESIQLLPGRGLAAEVLDDTVAYQLEITLTPNPSRHTIAIRIDSQLAATVFLDEALRPALADTFDDLTADRLRLILSTGDGAARAALVPIEDRYVSQSPTQKLALIDGLNAAHHRVLYLGDGLNDGPAMAASYVGMTVTTAAPAIQDVASFLCVNPDWRALPVALRIARQAVRALRRNIAIALIYNLAGMAIAATGLLNPVTAALIMTVSSITVILMALNVLNLEVSGEDRVLVD